jgi:hypothetical protein
MTAKMLIDTGMKLKEEVNSYGLVVNERKTISMRCSRKETNENKF